MFPGDSEKLSPYAQDRIRTSMSDFALGRTPGSNGVRSNIQKENPKENPVTPAVCFSLLASGQRTDAQFFSSRGEDANLETELGDGSGDKAVSETREEASDLLELMSRLRAVQIQLDAQQVISGSPSRTLPNAISHHQNLPLDSNRENVWDIPARFHAGRESLSVKRNVTVRDSKRPKERS
jgi:hypothetical protein